MYFFPSQAVMIHCTRVHRNKSRMKDPTCMAFDSLDGLSRSLANTCMRKQSLWPVETFGFPCRRLLVSFIFELHLSLLCLVPKD
jgi:hypothetical protein